MTRAITEDDIAALVAVRSVIADAAHHPGRQAAIEAIDRLASAASCAECEKRKQADDRFMRQMLGQSRSLIPEDLQRAAEQLARELALEGPSRNDGCRCAACCREKFAKLPPETWDRTSTDALDKARGTVVTVTDADLESLRQARNLLWSKTSGTTRSEVMEPIRAIIRILLAAGVAGPADGGKSSAVILEQAIEPWKSIGGSAQRFVRHQLLDAVKRWECSDCHDTAETSPDQMRHPCGRCGGWMDRPTRDTACQVCGARFSWEKSVDMNVVCNGGTRTVTTCGGIECRLAVARTNETAPAPRLYAVKWTSPEGRSGLGAERAGRAYLERSMSDRPEAARQPGWTYEIVPAPEGDQPYKFDRDYVPAAWLDEACQLIRAAETGSHDFPGDDCWQCKAEQFLESL